MKDLEVTIRLRLGANMARWLMVGVALCALATEVSPESITLDTYYPAPTGIYVNMITTQQTILARDSGNVGVGTSNPQAELDVNGMARMQAFQMPTGATAGMALMSDASGNGTWQYCEFAP